MLSRTQPRTSALTIDGYTGMTPWSAVLSAFFLRGHPLGHLLGLPFVSAEDRMSTYGLLKVAVQYRTPRPPIKWHLAGLVRVQTNVPRDALQS